MVETQSPALPQLASQLRPQIGAALQERVCLADGCPTALREAIVYSLLAPGKRLRPMLALMAARACGGSIEAAMPAACAVEMIHAYSLVHDDLPAMDDDELRRGQPTCHKKFGEATAILAGDALLTMAFEVLAEEIQPPQLASRCCAVLAKAAGPRGMVGGQADDVASEGYVGDIERLESLHGRKTGSLIEASLRLGAMIAGAGREQMTALSRFGLRIGLAFQITDDLLDVRSSEAAAGKQVRKDAERGKLTFPGLLGLDESATRAEQLVREACRTLAPLGERAEGLEMLARYVLERNR